MGKKVFYGVYDTKYYDNCVGIFDSSKELADFFHTTRNTILPYITRHNLRECRYRIERGVTDE